MPSNIALTNVDTVEGRETMPVVDGHVVNQALTKRADGLIGNWKLLSWVRSWNALFSRQQVSQRQWGVGLLAFVVLGAVVACGPARAGQCDDPTMNTFQRSECWERRATEARAQVRVSFDRAVAAAETILSHGTT